MNGLNKQQLEAVTYNESPLLILAGAGSGKTRVLTEKIAYVIENNMFNPEDILAITFTNKAALEMRRRLQKRLNFGFYNMQISTFHALGLKIIKEQHELLKLNKNFTILDSDDSLTLIKKILKNNNLDPKHYSPYYIKEQISSAKNNLIGLFEYERLAKTDIDQVVALVYKSYQKTLIKNHSLDFDDLLLLSFQLLKDNDEILRYYQNKFKYILVDEYQDTNEVQYAMVKILASYHHRLCVVGDSDQSIYSWRGANYQNILNFEKDFPSAKVIMLEQNYRSTETILKSANSIIKNNSSRKEKKLWSDLGTGELLEHYFCNNDLQEASEVVRIINNLSDSVDLNEVCILYRTNAQSRSIEEALLKSNIPYRMVGGFQFYNRKEIKDLLAYLKLVNNQNDDLSLLRIINEPKRGIGNKTVEELELKAQANNDSIFNIIDDKKCLVFKNIIIDMKTKSENLSLTEIIDVILDKSGMRTQYTNGSLEDTIRMENLEEFKSITASFEKESGSVTLSDFLLEISLLTDVDTKDPTEAAVTLMTMHAAKGLEYNYVFIVGMEESIFPHFKSLDNSEALEEERRLCYVAITRAKKKCYLLNSKERMLFGQMRSNPPSRFLKEIDQSLIEEHNLTNNFYKAEQKKKAFSEDTDYKVGDKVVHKIYGRGVIADISGYIATIVFGKEIKKILVNHQALSKRGD